MVDRNVTQIREWHLACRIDRIRKLVNPWLQRLFGLEIVAIFIGNKIVGFGIRLEHKLYLRDA